jgi:hypothetical protein
LEREINTRFLKDLKSKNQISFTNMLTYCKLEIFFLNCN